MSYFLKLEDSNGTNYDFSNNFWIEPYTLTKNSSIQNIAYSESGRETADKFPKHGLIKIKGTLQGDTAAFFETYKNNLIEACLKGGKLRINDDIIDRYLEIAWANFTFGILEGDANTGHLQEIEIDFVCEKLIWQDYVLNESENILAGNGDFTVTVTGTNWAIKPIIEIAADQGADLTGILLRNQGDGNTEIIYNDEFFISGSTLIIDCEYGTVSMNNNDGLPNFTGFFIKLQPGENIFSYEGNACTITVKYRRQYIR